MKTSTTSQEVWVSTLFCDIKDFTALSDSAGADVIYRLLDELYRQFASVARQCSGYVDKVVGDGIIIVFQSGSPRERAIHAVSAALEMRAIAETLRSGWRSTIRGGDLRIRIGVSTSLVSISEFDLNIRRETTVIGSGVNLAARLQEKAVPDTILVDGATRHYTDALFDYQEMPGLELKGFSDEVSAFRVRGRVEVGSEATQGNPLVSPGAGPAGACRRRHARRPLTIDLHYHVDGRTIPCRTVDISNSGALLESRVSETTGSVITVTSSIPSTMGLLPINIDCRVVRTVDRGGVSHIAVEFYAVRAEVEKTASHLVREIFGLNAMGGESKAVIAPGVEGGDFAASDPWVVMNDRVHFWRRLDHEIQRTKRYGRDFTCMAIHVGAIAKADDEDRRNELIIAVHEVILETLRLTDDVCYLSVGTFAILAPETLRIRADTLMRRLLNGIERCLASLETDSGEPAVAAGSYVYAGENEACSNEVMDHILASCGHSVAQQNVPCSLDPVLEKRVGIS